MDNLEKELLEHINNCMDNIHINNDTDTEKPVEIIPTDDMQPPGSVRGEIIYNHPILTPEEEAIMTRRNFIMKVKIVALDLLDKPLFLDTSNTSNKDKRKLIDACQEVIDHLTEEQITNKFNSIVCNDIFEPKSDFTKLPIRENILI